MAELNKALESEAVNRLASARGQKALVRQDLQEALFFLKPRLSKFVLSTSRASPASADDVDDLATGMGPEVSEDFATEIISAFFPKGQNWVESRAELMPDGAIAANIAEDSLKFDAAVFASIQRSNFDAELAIALDPDLAVGTMGLMISADGAGRPYRVEHVPLRELEIELGPDGEIDGRFRVRWVQYYRLRALVGDVPLPAMLQAKVDKGDKGWVEVVWGWWRDWSKPADDVFQHALLVDRKLVDANGELTGLGSVPLVVSVFSPDRLHAFGCGPAIKSLQDFRVLDQFTGDVQDAALFTVKPPFVYDDDSVIDFEGGIEAGKAYPKRPGSHKPERLFDPAPIDAGAIELDRIEHRIRRKFFADYPEQRGDTPPTATQWVDEMMRAQRRIGTPGENFWRVGPKAIYERFAWLCEKDKLAQRPESGGKAIPLTPLNPAKLAQEQQKLQVAMRVLDIAKGYFPATSQAAIDEMATIKKIQALLRDTVIQFRSEDDVKALIGAVLNQTMGAEGGQPQG